MKLQGVFDSGHFQAAFLGCDGWAAGRGARQDARSGEYLFTAFQAALGAVDIQLLQRILRHKMAGARRKCEPMPSIGEYF